MSLEGIFRKELREAGLEGYDYTFKKKKTKHLIEGSANVKGFFEILVKADPDIETRLFEILADENVGGNTGDVMYTVITHENGHWKVCPFDIDFLEELLAGVSKGMTEAGMPKEKITKKRVWAKSNEVSDIIVNIALAAEDRNKKKWKRGRGIKYLIEAKQASFNLMGVKFRGKGYPQDYGIFVDTQMKIYNPDFRWMAPKFTKNYKQVERVIGEAIAVFSDDATAAKARSGPLDDYDLERICEKVSDTSNWYEIARQYAKLTAKYQTEPTTQFMTSGGGDGGEGEEGDEEDPQQQSGGGSGDEEDDEEGEGGGEGEDEDGEGDEEDGEGNGEGDEDEDEGGDDEKGGKSGKYDSPFHQVDPETISKIMQVSIQKGRDESEMAYASKYEMYKAGLEARAKDLIIDYTAGGEEESRAITINHLTSEKVEPTSMKKFKWGRTKCVITPEDDEWWLYEKIIPLQVEGDFNEGIGSLIDILFIIDKSCSMSYVHNCGKSSYELVEETVGASIKFLKHERKAYYQKFGLVLFGERQRNIFSGWQSYYELDNFYRLMYKHHNPQDGETILNPNAVNLAAREALDQFLVIMVSDGELHNEDQAVKTLGKVVEDGNFFTLFQIGGKTSFSETMKKYGSVFDDFNKPEYLQGLIIKQIGSVFSSTC